MEQGISFSPKAIWDSTSIAGKSVIIVLAIMGIYMLAVSIERWITFSRAKQRSLQFVYALQKKLADRDIKGALSLAQVKPQGPIAIVIEAALHEYIDGLQALKSLGPDEIGDFDLLDAVNRSIDRVKEREVADLKKGPRRSCHHRFCRSVRRSFGYRHRHHHRVCNHVDQGRRRYRRSGWWYR
jgi:hypothetical protein